VALARRHNQGLVIHTSGPFDIIGDVHGCAAELRLLLTLLGWQKYLSEAPPWGSESWQHPAKRKAVFVGDLVDRGPAVIDVLTIVRNIIREGHGYAVCGNHDDKLARWIRGRKVKITHGLDQSIAEIEPLEPEHRQAIALFLESLPTHLILDEGRLVVAHAGLREEMHGRESAAARHLCLYGETTGKIDERGFPVRLDWAASYRGQAAVVYGHTPVDQPQWRNNTVNIDTGAGFGGPLTALRYPERQFVSVPNTKGTSNP
jgi:protein phosphatase